MYLQIQFASIAYVRHAIPVFSIKLISLIKSYPCIRPQHQTKHHTTQEPCTPIESKDTVSSRGQNTCGVLLRHIVSAAAPLELYPLATAVM